MNPMTNPTACRPDTRSFNWMAAMGAVKSGTVAIRIDPSDAGSVSAAQAIRVNGRATLSAPSTRYSRQRRQNGGNSSRAIDPQQEDHPGDQHPQIDQRQRAEGRHGDPNEEKPAAPESPEQHQCDTISSLH